MVEGGDVDDGDVDGDVEGGAEVVVGGGLDGTSGALAVTCVEPVEVGGAPGVDAVPAGSASEPQPITSRTASHQARRERVIAPRIARGSLP